MKAEYIVIALNAIAAVFTIISSKAQIRLTSVLLRKEENTIDKPKPNNASKILTRFTLFSLWAYLALSPGEVNRPFIVSVSIVSVLVVCNFILEIVNGFMDRWLK